MFNKWTDRSHVRSYYDEVPLYANRLDGGRQWKVVGVSHNARNPHFSFREYAVRLVPQERQKVPAVWAARNTQSRDRDKTATFRSKLYSEIVDDVQHVEVTTKDVLQ